MTWEYKNKALRKPLNSLKDCETSLQLTEFLVDFIINHGKPLARKVLTENKTISQLVELKDIYLQEGGTKKATLRLDKSHEQEAIALYMVSLRLPAKPACKQCGSHKSRGPFKYCIGNDEEIHGGACLCCKYSGTPTSCSFVADISKRKEEEERIAKLDRMMTIGANWEFDQHDLKLMTSRKIEEIIAVLTKELDDREEGPRSTKRRRY